MKTGTILGGVLIWIAIVATVTFIGISYYTNHAVKNYRMWAFTPEDGTWTKLRNRLTEDNCYLYLEKMGPEFPMFELECYEIGTEPENAVLWIPQGGKIEI